MDFGLPRVFWIGFLIVWGGYGISAGVQPEVRPHEIWVVKEGESLAGYLDRIENLLMQTRANGFVVKEIHKNLKESFLDQRNKGISVRFSDLEKLRIFLRNHVDMPKSRAFNGHREWFQKLEGEIAGDFLFRVQSLPELHQFGDLYGGWMDSIYVDSAYERKREEILSKILAGTETQRLWDWIHTLVDEPELTELRPKVSELFRVGQLQEAYARLDDGPQTESNRALKSSLSRELRSALFRASPGTQSSVRVDEKVLALLPWLREKWAVSPIDALEYAKQRKSQLRDAAALTVKERVVRFFGGSVPEGRQMTDFLFKAFELPVLNAVYRASVHEASGKTVLASGVSFTCAILSVFRP